MAPSKLSRKINLTYHFVVPALPDEFLVPEVPEVPEERQLHERPIRAKSLREMYKALPIWRVWHPSKEICC
jgi:hypothetical protein